MGLKDELALQLISADAWTDRRRRDLVASVLLILEPSFEVLDAAVTRVDDKRSYRIDASARVRPLPFLSRAPQGRACRHRCIQPARAEDLHAAVPRRLALRLEGFLMRNPRQAESFRDIITTLFWSPVHESCLRGVYEIGYLDSLAPKALDRIRRKLSMTDRAPAPTRIRMNLLNGLTILAKRHREVAPAVREFITSDPIVRASRRILRADPDKDARTCGYYFLKAVREYQRGRAAGG